MRMSGIDKWERLAPQLGGRHWSQYRLISTDADPMDRVTSAQNATSSVFFNATPLPEAGHLL
jgi:hypothetical protein